MKAEKIDKIEKSSSRIRNLVRYSGYSASKRERIWIEKRRLA